MRKQYKGFTLIELMVVVIIVGILAAIAYPSYLSSVRKGNRADGKAAILKAQIEQEKFRGNCTQYATAFNGTGTSVCNSGASTYTLGMGTASAQGKYTLSFVGTANATSYTIRASGVGDQANDSCEPLQLVVTTSGASFTPANCW